MKKASGEKEAELLSEIRKLKQQAQKDKAELEKALEKAKEVNFFFFLFFKNVIRYNKRMPQIYLMTHLFVSLHSLLSHQLQERQWWTTAPAWSSRKQTLASERGWPAWYST